MKYSTMRVVSDTEEGNIQFETIKKISTSDQTMKYLIRKTNRRSRTRRSISMSDPQQRGVSVVDVVAAAAAVRRRWASDGRLRHRPTDRPTDRLRRLPPEQLGLAELTKRCILTGVQCWWLYYPKGRCLSGIRSSSRTQCSCASCGTSWNKPGV